MSIVSSLSRIATALESLVNIQGELRDVANQSLDELRLIRQSVQQLSPAAVGFRIRETALDKGATMKAGVNLQILDDGKGVLYTLTPVNKAGNPVPLPAGTSVVATSSAPASLANAVPDPGDPNATPPRPADTTGLVFLATVPQPPVDATGIIMTFKDDEGNGTVISTDAAPVDVTSDSSAVGFTITETAL